MNCRRSEDMARMARTDGWVLSNRMKDRIALVFRGFGQERLCETALQRLRDHETVESTSKELSLWRYYEVLKTSTIFKEHLRPELDVSGLGERVPTPEELRTVFVSNAVEIDGFDARRILKDLKWPSFTAQSEKKRMQRQSS